MRILVGKTMKVVSNSENLLCTYRMSISLVFSAFNVLCHLVLSHPVRQLLWSSFIFQTWELRHVADKVTRLQGAQLINAGAKIQTRRRASRAVPAPAAPLSYFHLRRRSAAAAGAPVHGAASSSGAWRMRSADPPGGTVAPWPRLTAWVSPRRWPRGSAAVTHSMSGRCRQSLSLTFQPPKSRCPAYLLPPVLGSAFIYMDS